MKGTKAGTLALAMLICGFVTARADIVPGDILKDHPTLKAPSADAVHAEVFGWPELKELDAAKKAEAEARWKKASAANLPLLDRLVATAAVANPRIEKLIELCSAPRRPGAPIDVKWLAQSTLTPALVKNLRLFYARWLAHERLYDDVLEQVRGLAASEVVDPASLLFCQAVGYHQLLEKEPGLRTIDRLLNEVVDVPQRYRSLAMLMRVDLEKLDDKTLDHIARRMEDIRRRLDLGQAGTRVVEVEDGVIKSLDKMIDDLEKQQQQQSASSSAGAMRPTQAMPDSRLSPLKAPGEVDRKNIGSTAGWGDMPAKQRDEALQQIGKDFPSHYRDAIEQYFRKLAAAAPAAKSE